MRGGNTARYAYMSFMGGLSPHARGKPVAAGLDEMVAGPIPACAGETAAAHRFPVAVGAYPRMRGGNAAPVGFDNLPEGLSPHARGKLVK